MGGSRRAFTDEKTLGKIAEPMKKLLG